MKRKIISLVVSAALLISPVLSVSASGGGSVEEKKAVLSEESAKLELWYNKPATNYNWVSSSSTKPSDLQPLVIGNGYMGAAIYGDLKMKNYS